MFVWWISACYSLIWLWIFWLWIVNWLSRHLSKITIKIIYTDIYSTEFDTATAEALRDCAKVCQVIAAYKDKFEDFVSPLLVLRVVQVTLYLCTLLYAASVVSGIEKDITLRPRGIVETNTYCPSVAEIWHDNSRVSSCCRSRHLCVLLLRKPNHSPGS